MHVDWKEQSLHLMGQGGKSGFWMKVGNTHLCFSHHYLGWNHRCVRLQLSRQVICVRRYRPLLWQSEISGNKSQCRIRLLLPGYLFIQSFSAFLPPDNNQPVIYLSEYYGTKPQPNTSQKSFLTAHNFRKKQTFLMIKRNSMHASFALLLSLPR